MAQIALHKARAVEIVYKETQMMKDGTCNAETLSISTAKVYRCGKTDHGTVTCKFKTAVSCLLENWAPSKSV